MMSASIMLPCGRQTMLDVRDMHVVEGYRLYSSSKLRADGSEIHYVRCKRPGAGEPYVYLHRLIIRETCQAVDHIDGNGLNNLRSNLRPCTHAENLQNSGPRRQRRYKNVFWHKRVGKWFVQITAHGQRINGGYFDTEEEGARKADELAIAYQGQYARLNFPDGGKNGDFYRQRVLGANAGVGSGVCSAGRTVASRENSGERKGRPAA